MPSLVPSWAKDAVVDANVRYGGCTGMLTLAVAVNAPVSKSCVGCGTTTWKVACTVCSVSTALNDVGEVGVTDQVAGAWSPSLTCVAGRSPWSVKDTVNVTGWPAVTVVGPVSASVVCGGARVGFSSGLTRYSATPCGGTFGLITPVVSVVSWVQRSRRK